MQRARAELTDIAWEIKERFYRCGQDIVRPIQMIISERFPAEEREPLKNGVKNPYYNADVADGYNTAYNRATKFLKEERNKVNDRFLPRYVFSRGIHVDNEAIREVKALLVDGCLDRLHEQLFFHAPMMVDEKDLNSLFLTLQRVVDGVEGKPGVKQKMTDFIYRFNAEYAEGVLPLADWYDRRDTEWRIPPVAHIPSPRTR